MFFDISEAATIWKKL